MKLRLYKDSDSEEDENSRGWKDYRYFVIYEIKKDYDSDQESSEESESQ